MIRSLIAESQKGNIDATLIMVEKFNPLLKKFAFKLHYEDAYNDLLVDFIELVHVINLDNIHDKSEGKMVSYIYKSINSSFIKKLKTIKKLHNCICVFRRHPDTDSGNIRTAYRKHPDSVSETSGHLVELTN